MLLFGHIGMALAVVWLAESRLRVEVDYRLVVLGSLLPDIIDKPVGMILLPLGNGRIFAHTLLFALLLFTISLRYRRLLFLTLASLLHLIGDEMWSEPETLLWPLFGSFPSREYGGFYGYIQRIISEYTPSFSSVFISEVMGLAVILAFLIERRRGFRRFPQS